MHMLTTWWRCGSRKISALCALSWAASVVMAGAPASAQSLTGVGFLPGAPEGSFSAAYGVSADGATVVGYGNGVGYHAFRWVRNPPPVAAGP
jgi:uncharacterized membrane protein